MKTVSVSDGSRMDAGIDCSTHVRGLTTAKDRLPNVILVGGICILVWSLTTTIEDRTGAADQAAVICQVGRCMPIDALVNQYRQLEQNPLPDR